MSKCTRIQTIRCVLLGAINGAVYAAVLYALISFSRAYFQQQYLREAGSREFPIVQFGSNERWLGISIAFVILFALSAYLVNRISRFNVCSPMLWLLVGALAVTGWNVFMLIITSAGKETVSEALTYKWVTSSSNPLYGPLSLGMAAVVNVLFGSAVRLFQKQEVIQPDNATEWPGPRTET